MWLLAEFEAVTLFSLKYSSATTSGGKTLLIPTPYAVKMALLDAACRTQGVKQAAQWWEAIRDMQIGINPPQRVVVSNLFQKILRPRRNPASPGDADSGPFQRTIGYREYAYWFGPVGFALGWSGEEKRDWLRDLVVNVNYIGKRGGFIQLTHLPEFSRSLPEGFIDATREPESFPIGGILQVLDDCDSSLTFEKANIFSSAKIRLGKERVTRSIVLPYRLVQSSKSFSLYERSQ